MNLAFQFIDLIVVVVVLVSAVYATYRGLVSESLAIIGWVVAAYATLFLGPYCAGWMRNVIDPKWLGELVGYGVVFLVVLIPLHFASSRIAVNVKRSQIGTLDSVLGTGFGALRGIAIVGVTFIVFMMIFPGRPPSWITSARLYPLIYASAEIVASVTPVDTVRVDGEAKRHYDEGQPAAKRPTRIDDLLQDLPFQKNTHKASDDIAAPAPEKPENSTPKVGKRLKPHSEKAQNEAAAALPDNKAAKHVKKTYGAKDRHALDRLIETSHSDASAKP